MLRPDLLHFTLETLLEKTRTKKNVTVGGLYGSAITLFIAELKKKHVHLVVVTTEERIEHYARELKKLIPETLLVDDYHLFYRPTHLIITTPDSLYHELQIQERVELITHQHLDREHLLMQLHATGFTREDIVEEENEYAVRGGIIDIFERENVPTRIEFYGDKIFSIRRFNTQNQRSIEPLKQQTLTLARLNLSPKPLVELVDKQALVVSEVELDLPFPIVHLVAEGEIQYRFTPARKYFGDLRMLREDIARKEYTYTFCIPHHAVAEKLQSVLGDIDVYPISIEEGFINHDEKSIYLTETELFGERKKPRHAYRGPFVDDLMGLREGDYVVHSDYGIGQFKGLTLIDIEERKVECLRIDYAGTDKVYLPIERMNLLERYIATDERPIRLSKLGSELWLKTKKRVKKSTERLALDLVRLYSQRMKEKGFSFSKDTFEMKELEATFPYEETEDQLKAINDVKLNMESWRPQERLICGDVGYGKTEIALRAAFKATLDSKQTMLLCPTTLLAFQHYNTFKKRLAPFPVTVEMLSRFRKKKEVQTIAEGIASGKIDMVIGTHRVLQPDIQFKDLGLLIIDEEQRFGVEQKEKIKKLKPGIDVLYLSATPIPRTLYMALTGIKDISNIYTPPPGRKDIITKVMYFDSDEIRKNIASEIERGGQVFFVHNRIKTIETVRAKLHTLLPHLRICLLHGRMREHITAQRMVAFLNKDYDVLLSTAIVESGLDMPRVNTIIVDNAHTFGLADLHQLRGRVGRSDIQGYAYFIVPSRSRMSEEANKRLGALASYTFLGSGFRLALRDMEIRGIGNLLGKEQTGYINAIGYHHYIKILQESVSELKGKRVLHEPILSVTMDAYFPTTYIESAYERTALYKRLLDVESTVELKSIRNEIVDRFGQYPREVNNLFLLSQLRLQAQTVGATEVVQKGNTFIFYREGTIVHERILKNRDFGDRRR